ncbi:DUF885 domain-containing protein [Alteromonas ponticola]|uniref:DUF885 domain-containing protein n=1 Tax=Alteromonas ponticola TaxID=2720613 RepID=A0ABX1QY33_9ALTE|nr:DUF885 domain-containing protein [Alteromonas ponticola]NMH59147.1 DUF885 domain-containing protein [Alteromonas ponticola]
MFRICLLIAIAIGFITGLSPQASAAVQTQTEAAQTLTSADEKLTQFLESHWQSFLQDYPEYASYLGMANKEQSRRWTDNSLKAIEQRYQSDLALRKKMQDIDRAALSAAQKVNYDLFKWQLDKSIEEHEFKTYLIPITQLSGVHTLNDFANIVPLNSVEDYRNWLVRLERLPTLIAQTRKLMEKGMSEGIMPAAATMQRVAPQLDALIVEDAKKSVFYTPFAKLPDHFSDADKQDLQTQAVTIIDKQLTPAYRDLKTFFTEQYLPGSKEEHGVWARAKGKQYYEYLVRYYTTTDMTPDAIHQLGLEEVARNRAEMDKVIAEVGFEGTFEEFLTFLRTDPQFYYESPEALFEGYLAVSKRLDPELTKLFGKLPRAPYGLKPIPDNTAPQAPTAYYSGPSADGLRPGWYYVNLHQPETRPKYEMEVLSVHEAVPGHHLQIALQMELGELPMFRRFLGFTVFTEGWGLYSERLGYDMNLYTDPYSRFGQLTYDMWRSIRLVVDTGIHYKGWTRQEAIDYFKANAAKSEEDITNEVDRYIAMPGQALAYKIGQLKMLELREKATSQLGDKFDIRAFHDTMLGSGSVPLNVLESNINEWIAEFENE